ncbi:MAG: LysR family transcriptional regulator, partial [Burkholderiales bacterium]
MDLFVAMQTFAKVAELGSFTQAAQVLQLPNASVSTRVSQLEDRLGVKLFARTTRRVRLTDDGAAYLLTVQRLLADIDEVEDHLKGRTRKPRGRIRIDVPASAGRHVIAPAL